MAKISAWGNYPVIDAEVSMITSLANIKNKIEAGGNQIAYGNGRSYGDAPLQKKILHTGRYNKFLSFDEATGELCCQSGVLFSEILDVFVPQGWFLPVTPGTKLLTVGGAIAADVHGKNHHKAGCFGDHLLEMNVVTSDGSVSTCSPEKNADFFRSTIGGMGLTGIILNATFKLKRINTAYIKEEKIRCNNLNEIMDCFEASDSWTYSVAWIDCLAKGKSMGRSIMMRGEHAQVDELSKSIHRKKPLQLKPKAGLKVPFTFPDFALNNLTMNMFNFAYYNMCSSKRHTGIVDYNTFFYPLDAINNWNRIYGKRGFTQYQFVIPKDAGRDGMDKILNRITKSGLGSFLAVLKLLGKQDGLLSFPMEGYTLALDFPITAKALKLFDELDAMVAGYGGRLYLAKDSRMSAQMFKKSYPNAEAFTEAVYTLNQGSTRFASLQSTRLGITEEEEKRKK